MVCLCEDLLSVRIYQMLWHQIKIHICLQHIQRVLRVLTLCIAYLQYCVMLSLSLELASHYWVQQSVMLCYIL